MATIDQVVTQMQTHGLPPIPANGIVCDGKSRRFGPKKKAWYKLTKITTKTGSEAVYGVFGYWRGTDNGAIGVSLGSDEVDVEEMAAVRQRQEEAARREAERIAEIAQLAANRARMQWDAASDVAPGVTPKTPSAYLERKRVEQETARITDDGTLLVPMRRYSRDGVKLVGLQKIKPDGSKLFNKGMDKVGAACLLGKLPADAPLLIMAEGYATGGSIRLATKRDFPVMLAFDAGNLIHVAQQVRRDFPGTHILFAADDDWQLKKRLAKRLVKDFKIAATIVMDGDAEILTERDFSDDGECDAALKKRLEAAAGTQVELAVDGTEQILLSEDGERVRITPAWKKDENGVDYLEADVRTDRVIRTLKLENAGIAKATAAARTVGNASVVWPSFADRGENKWTDFNDLHVEQSLDAVVAQLEAAIAAALQSPKDRKKLNDLAAYEEAEHLRSSVVPESASRREDSPAPPVAETQSDGAPAGDAVADSQASVAPVAEASSAGGKGEAKKKPKKEYGQEHWDKVHRLEDNFVLIYGDDTAWDSENRVIIKINHLRLAFGSDAVKFWLNSPKRRMVNKDCVVFDPTLQADPDETVNLFDGFKMKPKRGKCDKIVELLLHLCGNDAEVLAWVLRWIAYPLQNPGAKMRTSIIMHGDEGSGKNLFWENVVAKIYGEYGGVIGNAQIESQFNEWASKKLFFVADEVVTRNELRQLKGKLKHMVTGEVIMINPKGMTERAEANHMNFVFLSNELQPLALDKTDRRYLVLWTPPKRDESFYREVSEQIRNGGIEAFYHYLLHEVPMDDFTEHTKPLVTEAKVKLIALGLTPPQRFYREWSGGFLPLPFVCCSAMQLYHAFCRWCHLNGERFPVTQTMFGRDVERAGSGTLRRRIIKYDLGNDVKQRTVYLVGDQPEDKSSLSQWVEDASGTFETYLKKYRHVYDQPNE
ncbi:hypothetical protein EDC30_104274 [Paucimonas lemoignei]|uniref:NrS-1 polymerase-like helicase domain-containing protein n=1 Tax=Paucimonas lemoignei TaxID=29443 RepID=A0A4V6NXZ7_PAULE|nr:DUF5906 domain-containing protein [Paucimonas lemoignei]TCS37470.1 hypothetical protein EDC30_104274 [Paucimonas lemoignei]